MALFNTKPKPIIPEVSYYNEVAAKIQQRRYQILVHSLLYYELDISLISDSKWTEWAVELAKLQKENPDVAKSVIFADAFEDFDGSTGFDLPYRDAQIIHIASRLLRMSSDLGAKNGIMYLSSIQPIPPAYEGFSYSEPKKSQNTQRKVVKKVESTKRKKLF